MKVFIVIDDKLYKVSKKDAEHLRDEHDDLLFVAMEEIEKKYKPIQEHIAGYNY